jgi:Mrp family chromosome partitioning ATPase
LAGLQAKKDALATQLHDVQGRIQQLSQLGPRIADLERQKQLEETNYKYFEGTLEKARVDEALDPSKMPNISAVQRASPPFLVTKTRNKVMGGFAIGGLALGALFALLKELMLRRTISRPIEIEKFVGVTPLMSIPYTSKREISPASKRNGKADGLVPGRASDKNVAPWDANHFMRPYCEAIRDRLGLYFELHHLTHKPKLVGVAGFSEGGGTSTLAAGLAAALSETNDGKVLLVDANLGPDQVHPFFKGRPAYALNAALTPNGPIDAAAENLYLATVGSSTAGPAQLGLKKFFDLMPNLKASDFDYIIFDMPILGQTSPTLGMAAFMDKVLLVVEAGKDSRETVKRGYKTLVRGRDNVSVVVNKSRSYTPKWVDGEL